MPYWARTFSTGYRNSTGQLNVTSSQSSAIVSILSAGTFFGALGASPMGDIIGRRWGLIASNGVFVLGVVLQTIATSIPPFLAGRFFAGLGVGLISALGEAHVPPAASHRGAAAKQVRMLTDHRLQFLSTSPKQRQSGFEDSSSAPTSLPSRSVSCWHPSSITQHITATTRAPTASPLPCNSRGPSFLSVAC
jgi:hypothetical protein